jgi:hypothetical protein
MSYLRKSLLTNLLAQNVRQIAASLFHTSPALDKKWNNYNTGPTRWPEYNKKIYPPQMQPDEEKRPAVSFNVVHSL